MAKKPENIAVSEKIKGILAHPKKIFSKLKTEDMLESLKLYAGFMIIITIIGFSVLLWKIWSETSLFEVRPLQSFGFLLVICMGIYLALALVIPSLIVACYYSFLKLIFKMKSEYEQFFKAIIYSMLQIWIFGIILALVVFILYQLNTVIAIIVGTVLAIIIIIYNVFTEIYGLSILCGVKTDKAFTLILLQILVIFIVAAAALLAVRLFGSII